MDKLESRLHESLKKAGYSSLKEFKEEQKEKRVAVGFLLGAVGSLALMTYIDIARPEYIQTVQNYISNLF